MYKSNELVRKLNYCKIIIVLTVNAKIIFVSTRQMTHFRFIKCYAFTNRTKRRPATLATPLNDDAERRKREREKRQIGEKKFSYF